MVEKDVIAKDGAEYGEGRVLAGAFLKLICFWCVPVGQYRLVPNGTNVSSDMLVSRGRPTEIVRKHGLQLSVFVFHVH